MECLDVLKWCQIKIKQIKWNTNVKYKRINDIKLSKTVYQRATTNSPTIN